MRPAAIALPEPSVAEVAQPVTSRKRAWPRQVTSWLQVAPLAFILFSMILLPLLCLFVVSFFDYGRIDIRPAFLWDNYQDVFESRITLRLYLNTLRLAAITLAVTLVLGFLVAYFLCFHVRSGRWRSVLLITCSIPFFTSSIIRMISWIPFLGRHGIINQALVGAGFVSHPLEFLLFSNFAVIIAYVHIFSMMMVGPIINAMSKIDRSLIAAARDAGAGEWQIVRDIIAPLSRSGIAIGSVLVLTQVVGDYYVVQTLSGGQTASVMSDISTELNAFEYPPAAASAMVLLVTVTIVVAAIFRLVDVRRELVE